MQNDVDIIPTFRIPFLLAVLPLPPGVNHSYKIVRHGKRGGLAATDALNDFKAKAAELFPECQQNKEMIKQVQLSKPALSVTLRFYHPDARRRDVDGNIKATLDAAFKYLNLDDSLVVDLYARKTIDRSNPRCEIAVMLAGGV